MAYNEALCNRIREALSAGENVEEKAMFGGMCFMINGKMCVGVMKDEMMCRIEPDECEASLERPGARAMTFTGRPMKGMILVNEHGLKKQADFNHWMGLCLKFNPKAKASKKKK